MNQEIETILSMHADRLLGQGDSYGGSLQRNVQVQGLLNLAENLHGLLKPVEPDPDFRRRLHGELILAAQQRQETAATTLFQRHRKGILLGAAAAGSAASIAGVVLALVWRHRQGRATHAATG